jgi:hypothetical protein
VRRDTGIRPKMPSPGLEIERQVEAAWPGDDRVIG